jgi:dethiobiotin synthetase
MHIFITGTDTNIGKTVASSWLCLHTGYDYFKPIQTGYTEGSDSGTVFQLAGNKIHKEAYVYKEALSPHLAANFEKEIIDVSRIKIPKVENLIIEGVGGLLVPINKDYFVIDLIKYFSVPVILVGSSRLGTINHTLLSLEALRARKIETLGVIVCGNLNQNNCDAIELYGKTKMLAQIPYLSDVSNMTLSKIPFTQTLKEIFLV